MMYFLAREIVSTYISADRSDHQIRSNHREVRIRWDHSYRGWTTWRSRRLWWYRCDCFLHSLSHTSRHRRDQGLVSRILSPVLSPYITNSSNNNDSLIQTKEHLIVGKPQDTRSGAPTVRREFGRGGSHRLSNRARPVRRSRKRTYSWSCCCSWCGLRPWGYPQIELQVAKKTPASTLFFGKRWARNIALGRVHYWSFLGEIIGTPAAFVLCYGKGSRLQTKIVAKAVGLVYADVYLGTNG